MGCKGGVDAADMMDVICQSAVASPLLQHKRDIVVSGGYEAAFAVKQIMKDFDIIVDVARHDHCPMSLVWRRSGSSTKRRSPTVAADLDFFILAREASRIAGLPWEARK